MLWLLILLGCFFQNAFAAPIVTDTNIDSPFPGFNSSYSNPTIQINFDQDVNAPIVSITPEGLMNLSDCGDLSARTFCFIYNVPPESAAVRTIAITDANNGTEKMVADFNHSFSIETTIPTLSNVRIESNNLNPQIAKPGDLIRVRFTSSEPLLQSSVIVTIANNPASVSNNGNDWNAIYTIKETDAPGIIPFTIEYKDVANNSGATVSAITEGSNVILDNFPSDKTPPETTVIGFQTGWNRQFLNIDLICTDSNGTGCAQTAYNIDDYGSDVGVSGLTHLWTFDDILPGNIVKDSVGNANGTTRYASFVPGKIGNAMLFASDTPNDTDHIGADVNLGVDDGILGTGNLTICTWMSLNNIQPNINPDDKNDLVSRLNGMTDRLISNGLTIFYVTFGPVPGTYMLNQTNNDPMATYPNGSAAEIYLNTWQHVCLTRSSTGVANFYIDGNLSGLANQTGGGTPTNTPNPNNPNKFVHIGNQENFDLNKYFDGMLDDFRIYNRVLSLSEIRRIYAGTKTWSTGNSFSLNSDHNFKIDFNSTDNNGNVESTKTVYIAIDTTAPQTTSDINTMVQTEPVTVTLTCMDPTSGCASTQYRLDTNPTSGVTMGGWNDYTGPFIVSSSGNWKIDFNSTDAAGNPETTKSAFLVIRSGDLNLTAPITISDVNSDIPQRFPANITLLCTDNTSDCIQTQYRIDTNPGIGINMGNWINYNGPFTISMEGHWALDFNSKNANGISEETNREFVLIDTRPPLTTSDVNNSFQSFAATVKLTCRDESSGCNSTQYRLDLNSGSQMSMGNWIDYNEPFIISIDGNWRVDFNSTDIAGNVENTRTVFALIRSPNLLLTNTTSSSQSSGAVTLSLNTNKDANCRYSTNDQNYSLMQNDFVSTGAISHATVISGLQNGDYTYYAACSAPNVDTNKIRINFSVSTSGNGGGSGGGGGSRSIVTVVRDNNIIVGDTNSIDTNTSKDTNITDSNITDSDTNPNNNNNQDTNSIEDSITPQATDNNSSLDQNLPDQNALETSANTAVSPSIGTGLLSFVANPIQASLAIVGALAIIGFLYVFWYRNPKT